MPYRLRYAARLLEKKDQKSFKRHICCFSFLTVFLDLLSILVFLFFNFHSILYRFNDLLYRLNDIINRLTSYLFFFNFRSNFLVSISFLINIGKEMSLPGFRRFDLIVLFQFVLQTIENQAIWFSTTFSFRVEKKDF